MACVKTVVFASPVRFTVLEKADIPHAAAQPHRSAHRHSHISAQARRSAHHHQRVCAQPQRATRRCRQLLLNQAKQHVQRHPDLDAQTNRSAPHHPLIVGTRGNQLLTTAQAERAADNHPHVSHNQSGLFITIIIQLPARTVLLITILICV